MAVIEQIITDNYALYNGDSCEVLPQFPKESIGYILYSPPFADLYQYSSSDRDLSNNRTYEQFLEHYRFIVEETARLIQAGRLITVHCMDVARGTHLIDLPGDIVRLHEEQGLLFHDRKTIWKEPLKEAIRTRALGLKHAQLVKDSAKCRSALADYLLTFSKPGKNKNPIQHPECLTEYYGEMDPKKRDELGYAPFPEWLLALKGHKNQKENAYSHWIWRRYASSVWSDVRRGRVCKYKKARESEEEKHICPLQLDTIQRCLTLYSNPGDRVLTPFMGVGSEVYGAVVMERFGIGIELKPTYFRQAVANVRLTEAPPSEQSQMEFEDEEETTGLTWADADEIEVPA